MKKLSTILMAALALGATIPARAADRTYTLCDPAKAVLCSNLVALYEFEEAANSDRTSETGSAPFIEPAGGDVAVATSAQNPGPILGAGALDPNPSALATNYVYIPRVPSLGGSFTINLWVYVVTDSAGDSFILSTRDANNNRMGSGLYFTGSSGSRSLRFKIWQQLTDTATYVTSNSTVSSGAWHFVAFGVYATPTTSEPYQVTLWMRVDDGTKTTTTAAYPPQVFLGDFILGDKNLYGDYMFDQLSVFSGTLSDAQVAWLYNSGSGRAYPFTANP